MENQRRGVKEGGRILATTFLSLLLPLSFLLLARLSAARFFSSAAMNDRQIPFLTSLFFRSKTTLILSFLVFAVAIGALLRGLNGDKSAPVMSKRRRSCVAWVLISLVQVCLNLGIHATAVADAEISGFAVFKNLVLLRRAVFVLGLHEVTVFWRRSFVAPVVDETVAVGFSGQGCGWVETTVFAVAFGNLWWRRLRDEAEALVALPWLRAELEVADGVGWLLYYLTAAIGGVRVIKGFALVAMWIFSCRRWLKKKEANTAVNIPV